jgi:hypothetical protein
MSTDSSLTCRDCGQPFVFTLREQDYYASRGFDHRGSPLETRARGGWAPLMQGHVLTLTRLAKRAALHD